MKRRRFSSPEEIKIFDTQLYGTTIPSSTDWTGTELDPSTGGINCLFAPTQGAAINQRVGRQIWIKKLCINAIFITPIIENAAGIDNPNIIRFIIVLDKQTNGTQCQGEQIMTPPPTPNTYVATCSFKNVNFFHRFDILYEKMIVLDPNDFIYNPTAGNYDIGGYAKTISFEIPFENELSVRFNATNGGTIADIIDNSLHCICNSTSNDSTLYYYSRIEFHE